MVVSIFTPVNILFVFTISIFDSHAEGGGGGDGGGAYSRGFSGC